MYSTSKIPRSLVQTPPVTILSSSPKFSILYFPYQKDERAKPGNFLTKWCHLPLPLLHNIKASLMLPASFLCSVLFIYQRCLCTVLVFVTVACLGYVNVLRRWFIHLSAPGWQKSDSRSCSALREMHIIAVKASMYCNGSGRICDHVCQHFIVLLFLAVSRRNKRHRDWLH